MRYRSALLVFISCCSLSPFSLLGQSERPIEQEPLKDFVYVAQSMPVLLVDIDPEDSRSAKQQRDAALQHFIYSHLRYVRPDICIQGTVILQFTITEEGLIDPNSLDCVRGIHPDFDEEAKRVVRLMSALGWRWQPGTMAGKPVAVRYSLPIRFNLY